MESSIGSCAGFIVLNEGCYGGGVRLWDIAARLPDSHVVNSYSTAPTTGCSNNDGRLDVIAARTLFQLGTLVSTQINVIGGVHRIAQGDSVQFTFTKPGPDAPATDKPECFVQVDGEGFLLVNPASVTIRRSHRTLLLKSTGKSLP